ncbi:MAG TPA: DoxX family protein [Candidatus Tectomicrobia bacterium]|nr:DoxX family protein [Candidatus Tectomicrobia bacterium]
MINLLGPYAEILYAILRIAAGFLFACHGAQKLFGVLGGEQASEPMMLLAGVIELVGGVLIALGLLAAPAAFVASGQMAVAYLMQHAPQDVWPIVNTGELALLYCVLFLYVASRGAGRFSIDAARRGR